MVGRKRVAEGRRVTVCAKLSETEAAALDRARGDLPKGSWVREAILAELERRGKIRLGDVEIGFEADPGMPPGVVELRSGADAVRMVNVAPEDTGRRPGRSRKSRGAAGVPATAGAAGEGGGSDCPHPKARVLKGFCGACGRFVGAK